MLIAGDEGLAQCRQGGLDAAGVAAVGGSWSQGDDGAGGEGLGFGAVAADGGAHGDGQLVPDSRRSGATRRSVHSVCTTPSPKRWAVAASDARARDRAPRRWPPGSAGWRRRR